MRDIQTLVQLSEQLVALLDRRAVREGVSRASVIRAAVEAYLDTDALVDQQIVTGYRNQPQWADEQPELDADEPRRRAWDELEWPRTGRARRSGTERAGAERDRPPSPRSQSRPPGGIGQSPRRGEIWWATPPRERPRPVLVLTRDKAIDVMQRVLVAPLTTTVRDIPTEVRLDRRDGVQASCALSLDDVAPLSKSCLMRRLATLSPERMAEVRRALNRAAGG